MNSYDNLAVAIHRPKKSTTFRSFGCALALISAIAMAGYSAPATAQSSAPQMKDVSLSLGFIAVGRYAPFYLAAAKGYYKEEGLNVTFVPSQGGTSHAIQAIQSGLTQFAITDLAGVMVGKASGVDARMIAIYYQKAPYAIFSTEPGANVTKLKQLEGLEVGTGAGSATPKIIEGIMREKGFDPSKIKYTNLDPNVRVSLLLSGKIPAIETFILGKPGIEKGAASSGKKLTTLLLADEGLELYSSGIAATDAYLKANPDIVKGFVRASLKGWRDSFKDPVAAAKAMMSLTPGLTEESIVKEVEIVKELQLTPLTESRGLGSIDSQHFETGVKFLNKYGGLAKSDLDAKTLFSTDYLPNPPIKP